jgi:hypothetical protein
MDTTRDGTPLDVEVAGRAGGATLAVFWGWILLGNTSPSQPFGAGAWSTEAMLALFGLGLAAGAIGGGAAGIAGIAAGIGAGVGLQLFVLTAQAAWTPAVVSNVVGDAWLRSVATTVAASSFALLGGCLVALGVAGPFRVRRPQAWLTGLLVASVAIAAGSVALVATLLVDASTSRYVASAGEPTLTVSYRDGSVSVEPATVPAGRVTIVGPEAVPAAWLMITWGLSAEQQAALAGGRLTAATVSGAMGRTRTELEQGTHAAVAIDARWTPPSTWDGSDRPILAAATFTVAPAVATQPARGDAGPMQVAGLVAALAIHAAAVFAFVAWAIVWGRSGPQGEMPIGIPATTAAATTTVLGAVALLAVDLVHNPF